MAGSRLGCRQKGHSLFVEDWIFQVISTLGYLGLALLLVAENLFPPIPSEVVLPLAGFVVGRGDLSFVQALLASTTGSVVGALILYALGRYGGRGLVLRYGSWLRVSATELERAEGWFRRYGGWVVLGARVVPFARSIVSIPAGTMRMPLIRFTVLTALGSGVWNALLIGAGVSLGANWTRISGWIGSYSGVVLILLTGAAAVFLVLRHRRRKG
jgi:membrane protein DedA with SNARE-associated domain